VGETKKPTVGQALPWVYEKRWSDHRLFSTKHAAACLGDRPGGESAGEADRAVPRVPLPLDLVRGVPSLARPVGQENVGPRVTHAVCCSVGTPAVSAVRHNSPRDRDRDKRSNCCALYLRPNTTPRRAKGGQTGVLSPEARTGDPCGQSGQAFSRAGLAGKRESGPKGAKFAVQPWGVDGTRSGADSRH
jgi:hypothetical protein